MTGIAKVTRLSFLTLLLFSLAPPSPAGTLRGRVELGPPQATKRVEQRYPQGPGGTTGRLEPIPSVAFLKGPVPGVTTSALPGRHTMTQRDTLFVPNLLVIPKGGTVDFPNEDDELHNVFSYSKARRFDLGRYPRGESKSVDFERPGIVKIYCEIHPWMQAVVVVVENPFFAIVQPDGEFVIDGVPPGEYTVVVWNVDAGSEERTAVVPATGALDVPIALTGPYRAGIEHTHLRIADLAGGPEGPPQAPTDPPCCTIQD